MSRQETIGIVGYGHIAQRHLKVIRNLKPDCRIVILTRRSAEKSTIMQMFLPLIALKIS